MYLKEYSLRPVVLMNGARLSPEPLRCGLMGYGGLARLGCPVLGRLGLGFVFLDFLGSRMHLNLKSSTLTVLVHCE